MSDGDPISTCRDALERGDLRAARSALETARAELYRLEGVLSGKEHGAPRWAEAENRVTRAEKEALR